MEEMAQRYPDDYEVQVVYALTLQASASKSDLTYSKQLQSVAILEKLFEQNPQHPGVSHFIIHAYDFAPLADRGIAAAKRYASIAPAVPHARHMPSHIFRWWECGRSRSLRTLPRLRSSRTTTTLRISRCMRTCSLRRTSRRRC